MLSLGYNEYGKFTSSQCFQWQTVHIFLVTQGGDWGHFVCLYDAFVLPSIQLF